MHSMAHLHEHGYFMTESPSGADSVKTWIWDIFSIRICPLYDKPGRRAESGNICNDLRFKNRLYLGQYLKGAWVCNNIIYCNTQFIISYINTVLLNA